MATAHCPVASSKHNSKFSCKAPSASSTWSAATSSIARWWSSPAPARAWKPYAEKNVVYGSVEFNTNFLDSFSDAEGQNLAAIRITTLPAEGSL